MSCPKEHPVRGAGAAGFAPGLEVLGSYSGDTWLRCSECGRFFWSIDDTSKFTYQNDWELVPTALARSALVDHDAGALARLFVSMNLPYGPVWELTSALVAIFRLLTPAATDAERARAIEQAGPHPRWSAAARALARELEPRPEAAELAFPVDLHAPGVAFEEWYEVGDAVVLLTGNAELFRLEPRGLVRVGLTAPPRYLSSGHDRLVLAIRDVLAVLDDAGTLTSWPLAGEYNVTDLDGGWWLFIPATQDTERLVEMHLPDGRPRVKLPRRFGPLEGWMPPPRRLADGWIFSNLIDVDGKTQALTLLDAAFKTLAWSEEAVTGSAGDRLVTPIESRPASGATSFWACTNDAVERWVRRDKTLACVDRFEARASWLVSDLLVSAEASGAVAARAPDGAIRWTWHGAVSGALYATETIDGVLLYDDTRAHLLDLGGAERRSFEVESPTVLAGKEGTVYVKSLADCWIVREDARAISVGLGASLETTCGDDAIVRTEDGTCLLIGKEGVRGRFAAPRARFSVIGTRGGPWIVEGDHIRGAFAKNAHVLAEAIAVGAKAAVRRLPARAEAAYAVLLPDGRVPLVVRQFHGGAVSVCPFPGKGWHPGPADHPSVATEAVAFIARWSSTHVDRPTIAETALFLADALTEAFAEPWTISIPGTPEPTEMSLAPEDHVSAHVGVFEDCVVASSAQLEVASRDDLRAKRDAIATAVRAQRASYERNLALSERVRAVAAALATQLSARLARPCASSAWRRASYYAADQANIAFESEPHRHLATISADEGVIRVHAGVPGELGFDGEGDDAGALLEGVVAAIERSRRTLTIDRLVAGRRYRVIADNQGLKRGDVVRFERFDDIDNHYGEYLFVSEDGREAKVTGDFSTPASSPLGDAYRYLEEV